MRRIPFVILLFCTRVFCSLEIQESLMSTCITHQEKYWKIARLHFVVTKSLTITLLQTDKHTSDLMTFTNRALKDQGSYDHFLTVKIEEKFLLNYTESQNRQKYAIFRDSTVRKQQDPITFQEFLKIKRLSSDVTEGYAIVVWNVETLQKFLDQNHKAVVPKARATYGIFLLSPDPGDCRELEGKINNILIHFWAKYNVFDIIAQTPCSCNPYVIYSYHPFHRINETTWGVVKNHTMDEVIGNFRLITNTVKDMNQFPFKVSLFVRRPTAIATVPKLLLERSIYRDLSSTGGIGGQDGFILKEIAKYLNFSIKLIRVWKNGSFGNVLPNGTITGSLNDIVNQRAMFSANGRFLMDYGTNDVEFTIPYSSDEICAITPKAKTVPQWMIFFKCFDLVTWCLIVAMAVLCTVFWFWLRPFKFNRRSPEEDRSAMKAWWEMLSILMGFPTVIAPSINQILFLSTCLFFNVVIVGIVQGSFFKAFTTVTNYKDIDTLEDLDRSGLPIYTTLKILDGDNSTLVRRLRSKKVYYEGDVLDMIAFRRNIATLERKKDVKIFIKIHYTTATGVPLLHVVDECLTYYFISYIVPRGSPFLTIFNHALTRLIESGLTGKWYNDVVQAMIMEKMMTLHENQENVVPFSMKDLQVGFYLLLIGFSSALLVFLGEIVYKQYSRLRH